MSWSALVWEQGSGALVRILGVMAAPVAQRWRGRGVVVRVAFSSGSMTAFARTMLTVWLFLPRELAS